MSCVAAASPARAADWPGEVPALRGAVSEAPARWDGFYFGGSYAFSRMYADFEGASSSLSGYGLTISNQSGPDSSLGGFIGYNIGWEGPLVFGIEGSYTYLLSTLTITDSDQVTTGSTTYNGSASITLQDYGILRGRVGYPIGQFLPYASLGVAVGRFSYQVNATQTSGGTTTTLVNNANDNSISTGLEVGLGFDVAVMPNIFLRGEYEYLIFGGQGGIRTQLSTARAGIAVRF